MQVKSMKLAGAVLFAASLLLGTGCRSHEQRATSETVKVEHVAVELEGQPDPWWDPRPPKRRTDGVPAQAPAQETRAPAVTAGRGSVSAAYPTGDPRTSAILIEKFFPTTVNAGAPFDYEIRVTNLTSLDLDNVQIWDSVPNNFRLISADPSVTSSDAGTLHWLLGSMGPREVRTIKVRGSAPAEGRIQACAKVSYDTSLCNEILVVKPALTLAVTTIPEALICDNIPIKYTVCNTGTGPATNVVVTETLPEGLTVNGAREVRFTAPALAAGQCQDFTVMAKAAKTGAFSFAGNAAAEGDLKATAEAARTTVRQAVLAVDIECPGRTFLGRNTTFKVTAENKGDGVAAGASLVVPVPAGSEFVSATGGGTLQGGNVVWNLGNFAPGARVSGEIVVRASSAQSLTARATLTGTCATAVNDQCQTNIEGIPAMLLDGYDDPDPIELRQTVTYTLTVTNQGSADLTNVRFRSFMDEGNTMEFVSATGATPDGPATGQARGLEITFPAVTRIAPGATATYRITVRAVKAGQVSFRAESVSNEITRPLIKVETTNFYE